MCAGDAAYRQLELLRNHLGADKSSYNLTLRVGAKVYAFQVWSSSSFGGSAAARVSTSFGTLFALSQTNQDVAI